MTLQELAGRFRGPIRWDRDGSAWVYCAVHNDGQKQKRQSLHLSLRGDGGILVHCFAGCVTDAVVRAVGATLRDLMPEPAEAPRRPAPKKKPDRTPTASYIYDYRDIQGELLYQVVRQEFSDGSKTFKQRRPDPAHPGEWIWNLEGVRRVLYGLQKLRQMAKESPLGRGWVLVVEGDKLADRLMGLGIPATTNSGGAGQWDDALFDQLNDIHVYGAVLSRDHDEPGERHMRSILHRGWAHAGLEYKWLELPGLGPKEDLADWLDRGGTREQLIALIAATPKAVKPAPPPRTTLRDVHAVARRWLGPEFDLTVIDAVLAATAAHHLNNGIPVWVIVISGSGAAKTECVEMLEGAGAKVESKIRSEASLLSASSHRERTATSTGGFLVDIGKSGILGLKDMTTVLSMSRNVRDEVLAALREIHDGRWSRLVGVDGGRRVSWAGRITVVAACTSQWDKAHEVMAKMGDRFVIVRLDSRYGRRQAFDQAIKNAGLEAQMKAELADATRGLMADLEATRIQPLTPADLDAIYDVANAAALGRGGVNVDYRLDVVETDVPELATRLGKQLFQLIRGGMAIGMPKLDAVNLALRCARDSMPPLRLEVLEDLNQHTGTTTADLWQRLNRPKNTVQRCLDALLDMRCITAEMKDDERLYHIQTDMVKGITAMSNIGKSPE